MDRGKIGDIWTWNVNGYTNEVHDEILKVMTDKEITIIFLTETKRSDDYMCGMKYNEDFVDFHNGHNPPRYHGVSMFVRKKYMPVLYSPDLNIPCRPDSRACTSANVGRLILVTITKNGRQIAVLGTYCPNSGRDQKNLEYRTKNWDMAIFKLLFQLREKGYSTIWLGDLNVAPNEIDVTSPSKMKKYAGFTPEERANFNEFLKEGWIDSYRYIYPEDPGYTWIGQVERMRLDEVVVSQDMRDLLLSASVGEITTFRHLSDHIPLRVTLG
jgi:exodeoxyribonuclease-3